MNPFAQLCDEGSEPSASRRISANIFVVGLLDKLVEVADDCMAVVEIASVYLGTRDSGRWNRGLTEWLARSQPLSLEEGGEDSYQQGLGGIQCR